MLRPGSVRDARVYGHTTTAMHEIEYIEILIDISLSERARLVHPWPLRAPTSKPPPFITCLTFPAVLCTLGPFFLFLLSLRVCACTPSTAPRDFREVRYHNVKTSSSPLLLSDIARNYSQELHRIRNRLGFFILRFIFLFFPR